MAKKRAKTKTKRFALNGFDNSHYKTTQQYVNVVDALFNRATTSIANAAAKGRYSHDKPFSLNDYPDIKKEVEKVTTTLASNITSVVEMGSRKQWLYACKKNDEFVASIMDTSKLTKARLNKLQDRNLDALHAFQTRKIDGLDLSKRVWNYVGQYKNQIELGLDVGLGDGRSAQALARDLKQNLKEPDRLFRRVRDKHGNLVLSKAAKAFNPGRGVYRSSVKNAQRLTRTEINMAYREADWLRWQQLDFVVGFEIKVSDRHEEWLRNVWNKSNKGKIEICDKLKGRYPKDFKFKGWHPQCMCYCVPVLMDEETFDKKELSDLKSALNGTEYKKYEAKNVVRDVPEGFKEWVEDNAERQQNWGSTPYFIKDNFKNGVIANGFKFALNIKPLKTEEQKEDIQKRWNIRIASNKYSEQLKEFRNAHGDGSINIDNLIDIVESKIRKGASMLEIDKWMDKLKHKIQVKIDWEERVENNQLEVFLVDAKGLKTKYDLPSIKAVYDAVESKLNQWEHLTLEQQVAKLKFEVDWVESNKKYDTWEVARDAYKKRLHTVQYLIDKKTIEASVAHSFEFAKTTKSINVKNMALELNTLLNSNSPIDALMKKASLLNNKVAELEAAKAARMSKKLLDGIQPADWGNESHYTKARKDAAMWAKTAKEADDKVRGVVEQVWQTSTVHERLSAYRYTSGSSYINEPLRGQTYIGQYLGKYDSEKDINALINLVDRSSYNFDIWVQRGVRADGFEGVFGIDIASVGIKNLNSLVGKTGVEKAFSSCGVAKGTGFNDRTVIYNIYCPRGTKMLYAEPFSAYGAGAGKSWDGKSKQSSFGGEAEVILQRGTKLRITKAEYRYGRYFIDAEIIEQP